MTKDEKIQIACSTIQSAIILDLFANVTDDTKKLITKQLSDIYDLGVLEERQQWMVVKIERTKEKEPNQN